MHPFIPVLSPSFLYHPSFKSKDFSFTFILSTVVSDRHGRQVNEKSFDLKREYRDGKKRKGTRPG